MMMIKALITKMNNPNVRIVAGILINNKTGLTIAFNIASTNATRIQVQKLSTSICGRSHAVNITAQAVIKTFIMNFISLIFNKVTFFKKLFKVSFKNIYCILYFWHISPAMSLLKKILIIFFLLLTVTVHAQFYSLGQDPATVKWNVIKTEHFRIIFPSGFERQAQYIANGFEQVYGPLSKDMKVSPARIPVVLHNNSVISNAEVPWAPKRIEFFTCPGQDDYAQPWYDQLMLHEFRHVIQYSKINRGFSRALSCIFGQQATAGILGAFVPFWFIEGDAVCTETAFSNSGRGRTPQFTMKIRAQVMEKGLYNYNKACFGSYKSFTPGRYEFGYQLVAAARKYYTDSLWEKALEKTARVPVMIIPFNQGQKQVSGMNKVELYKFCFHRLDSLWTEQKSRTKLSESVLIKIPENKLYASFNFPKYLNGNSYLCVRSGLNDVTRFICIDSSGKEHRLFTPGAYSSASFSKDGDKITWAENTSDPRWENRSYSVIKVYDLKKHRSRKLTHRTRFFAPDLDKQGKNIVCTGQSTNDRSSLAVIDAETGDFKKIFDAEPEDFLMTPRWSETGKEIVYIALNRYGKRICLLDSLGKSTDLTEAGYTEIAQPLIYKNTVFFIAGYSGINDIYALNTRTKKIFRVTSTLYGASDPSISDDGEELLYSEYTADGYRPAVCKTDTATWEALEIITDHSDKLYQSLITPSTKTIDFYGADKKTYPVKHYSKFLNLFNFHSWGPLSINADNTTVKPGIEIQSQNLLSTMFFSAGYEHEWNKPQSRVYAQFSYRGWYPEIDLGFSYNFARTDTITYNVLDLNAGINIPFNFEAGKYYLFLKPEITFDYNKLIPLKNYPDDAFSGFYQAMNYRIYGYNILKTSARDINPRWGQLLEFDYAHTPFSGAQLGDISAVQARLYFPGIGRHHSLSIYGAYQQRLGKDYIFSDLVNLPHGFDSGNFKKTLVCNSSYEMPLFYPDWSIGSLLYIKRFRASFYYDYAYVVEKDNNRHSLSSAGIAVVSDFHFLRFLAPISLGIRTTYLFNNSKILSELIYSVNFDQLRFKHGFSRY